LQNFISFNNEVEAVVGWSSWIIKLLYNTQS